MKVGGTQALGGTQRLSQAGGSEAKELLDKLKDLDKRQIDELVKAAQTYGPQMAMQMAQQMTGLAAGMKSGDFNLSDVDGSKTRGTSAAKNNSEDLEKFLKEILRKQEAASATDGAQSSGAQSQNQQQRAQQDTYAVNAPQMQEMY